MYMPLILQNHNDKDRTFCQSHKNISLKSNKHYPVGRNIDGQNLSLSNSFSKDNDAYLSTDAFINTKQQCSMELLCGSLQLFSGEAGGYFFLGGGAIAEQFSSSFKSCIGKNSCVKVIGRSQSKTVMFWARKCCVTLVVYGLALSRWMITSYVSWKP